MQKLSRRLFVGLVVLISNLGSAFADNPQLFPTEVAAQKHCPGDTVVWVNTAAGIYHLKGMR